MTIKIDQLEDAIDAACEALRGIPQRCGCCSYIDCKPPADHETRDPLVQAMAMLVQRWDRQALRLDHETASTILHPRFPRFGIVPCDADADVIPEVINLPLSNASEAAAIVWHLAQGRPDQESLASEAADRWDELQDLASTLKSRTSP